MTRKKYSCDFETTTNPDDCRVWAFAHMEIGNIKNFDIGNNLDDFMAWAEMAKADLYFHNLKFDGDFIINWLLKHGWKYQKKAQQPFTFSTTISKMGQWYMIDICYGYKGKHKLHTVIYDSLKKLPFTVRKIAKDFHLSILKGDIDYNLERPIGWKITEREKDYIKNDVQIVAEALEIQFSQGLTKMTNGSDALSGFKNILNVGHKNTFNELFPILDRKMDNEIRKAYRGGFTWVNKLFQSVDLGEGIVFDVNSLYPSQMYNRDLPYGFPIPFEGKYDEDSEYPLYVQCIECEFKLKPNHIPTIQIKGNYYFKENEYLESSNGDRVQLYVTNIDLKLIQEHYNLYDIEYINGFKFKKLNGIFKQYIDKWMYVKTHETGAKKLLAKLMLNSLYGKFATNTKVTGKMPYLKEDGACGYTLPKDEDGKVIDEFRDPVYTPMGVFITSWARYTTITTAQKCFNRIIYCDTDSIHLVGTEIPKTIEDIIDNKKLGYWKHESTFKRGRFLRQKTYIEEIYAKDVEKEGEMKKEPCEPFEATTSFMNIKCAGMPDNIKEKVTWDNFHVGFTSEGKLMPKHVNGGVVLLNSEFTIK